MSLSKALNKYHKAAVEAKKKQNLERLSKDPKRSALERKVMDLAEKVKKEGIR